MMSKFDMFVEDVLGRTCKTPGADLGMSFESVMEWLRSGGSGSFDSSMLDKAFEKLIDSKTFDRSEIKTVMVIVADMVRLADAMGKLTPTQMDGLCSAIVETFGGTLPDVEIMDVDDEDEDESDDPAMGAGFGKGMDIPSGFDVDRKVPDMEEPVLDRSASAPDEFESEFTDVEDYIADAGDVDDGAGTAGDEGTSIIGRLKIRKQV